MTNSNLNLHDLIDQLRDSIELPCTAVDSTSFLNHFYSEFQTHPNWDADIKLKSLLLGGLMIRMKNSKFTLELEFFKSAKFDFENSTIRIPLKEFKSNHQTRAIIGSEFAVIFVESSNRPGYMLPFRFDSISNSRDSYDYIFHNTDNNWRIIIYNTQQMTYEVSQRVLTSNYTQPRFDIDLNIIDNVFGPEPTL